MTSTTVGKPLIQTVAAVELYRSKRHIAQYLELCYLNVADHPDVAKEVRLTAQDARERHLLTTGLIKKFQTTSSDIVLGLIPNVYDAVDKQDIALIRHIFRQIIESAEIMQTESETIRTSYMNTTRNVQVNKESVSARTNHVKKENVRLDNEMDHQQHLIDASQRAQDDLDKHKRRIEEELQRLQNNRDQWLEEAAENEHEANNMDTAMACGLGNIVGELLGKARRLREKAVQAHMSCMNTMTQHEEMVEARRNERRRELQRLDKYKQLCEDKTSLGDVHSLHEASHFLGIVDKQLTKLTMFWSNMAAILTHLKDDADTGTLYLKRIKDSRFAARLKASIKRAETEWGRFNDICMDYAIQSDKDIVNLYTFLTVPVDSMSQDERDNRKQALLKQIKDDIDEAYDESMESAKSVGTQ